MFDYEDKRKKIAAFLSNNDLNEFCDVTNNNRKSRELSHEEKHDLNQTATQQNDDQISKKDTKSLSNLFTSFSISVTTSNNDLSSSFSIEKGKDMCYEDLVTPMPIIGVKDECHSSLYYFNNISRNSDLTIKSPTTALLSSMYFKPTVTDETIKFDNINTLDNMFAEMTLQVLILV